MQFDRIDISHELSSFIAERIARYELESAENQQWLVPYVKKFQILPLWSAWFETIGVQSDGSIYKFSADGDYTEYDGLRPIGEAAIVIYSLLEGARRYPQLEPLVPQRPEDASICTRCGGTGLPGQIVICTCGGLGWVRPGAA